MTMQLKFQQSIFEFFKVPQLQFIDRVVVTSVASQRQGSQCKLYRRPDSMVQFWEGCRHARWCANDRAMVQTVQNCGVPQVQCSDKVVDARCSSSTVWTSLCLRSDGVSRNWRCTRFSSSPETADNPVATEPAVAVMAAMKFFFSSSGLSRS